MAPTCYTLAMKKKAKRTRLSMKLLWKLMVKFKQNPRNKNLLGNEFTPDYFLEFVEEQMKPLKP